jgi:hypothetical protein
MFTAARGNSPAATLPQLTHAALFQPDYPLAYSPTPTDRRLPLSSSRAVGRWVPRVLCATRAERPLAPTTWHPQTRPLPHLVSPCCGYLKGNSSAAPLFCFPPRPRDASQGESHRHLPRNTTSPFVHLTGGIRRWER